MSILIAVVVWALTLAFCAIILNRLIRGLRAWQDEMDSLQKRHRVELEKLNRTNKFLNKWEW